MQTLAFTTGICALAVALFVALTGAGNRRDRIERFLIPSPLFIGAPFCGLVLAYHQSEIVVALANVATLLATLALFLILFMVGIIVCPTRLCR